MPTDKYLRAHKYLCPCLRQPPHEVRLETIRVHLKGSYIRQRLRRDDILLHALDIDRHPDPLALEAHLQTEEAERHRNAILNAKLQEQSLTELDLDDTTVLVQALESSEEVKEEDIDVLATQVYVDNVNTRLNVDNVSDSSDESDPEDVEPALIDDNGYATISLYDRTSIDFCKDQCDRLELDAFETTSINNFISKVDAAASGGIVTTLQKDFNRVLEHVDAPGQLSMEYKVRKALEEYTQIKHIRIDCCIQACCAYTGPYKDLQSCPYCLEPRYTQDRHKNKPAEPKPRCTVDYTSTIRKLRIQFADPSRARLLSTRPPANDILRDIWDGKFIEHLQKKGFFIDSRDVALGLSTDGIQLFEIGTASVWPILLTNFNLPADIRYNQDNQILAGIIPGPKEPKDMNSFMIPVVDELKLLEVGVPAWDAHQQVEFKLRAHLIMVQGDSPAMAKVLNFSGYNSYAFCWQCTQIGIYHQHGMRCPHYPPPLDHLPKLQKDRPTVKITDPMSLNMRSHGDWIYDAQIVELIPHESEAEKQRAIRENMGITGFSPLLNLKTINVPTSFVIDGMHVVLANVVPLLLRCWGGSFLSKDKDAQLQTEPRVPGQEHNEAHTTAAPEEIMTSKHPGFSDDNIYHVSVADWKEIAKEQAASSKAILTTVASSMGTIYEHKRWTAAQRLQWVLQSPIYLKDRLAEKYYTQWCSFVAAFQALLLPFSQRGLKKIRKKLAKFVVHYEMDYYGRRADRLHLCRSQIHSLLHLADSAENYGPISLFWQFPMERIAGRLKHKGHSRSAANRNISLSALHVEQINHIDYICKRLWSSEQTTNQPTRYQLLGKSFKSIMTADMRTLVVNWHYRRMHIEEPERARHLTPYNVSQLVGNIHDNHYVLKYPRAICSGSASDLLRPSIFNVGSDLKLRTERNKVDAHVAYNGELNPNLPTLRQFGLVLFFFEHKLKSQAYQMAAIKRFDSSIDDNGLCSLVESTIIDYVDLKSIEEPIGIITSQGQQYAIGTRTGLWKTL